MKKIGKAPTAPLEQWNGNVQSYIIHHAKPIHAGGNVYDFDNLYILTPKMHKEILDPKYHFNL